MAESKESKKLKEIYTRRGCINNTEFYECVRTFFYYLQHRYIGERVPEIDGDFWARLQESMKYYDPDRANIVSWVYTVGRNVCSSYNYQQGKREKESEDDLEGLKHETFRTTVDDSALDPELMGFVLGNGRVKAIRMNPQRAGESIIQMDDDNPIKRHVQWELLKLSLT